jgi:alkylglycerol monooxygenase
MITLDEGLRATLGLRGMFYLVSGKELAGNAQDIIGQAYIWFVVLIIVEFFVGKLRGHKTYRLNDGVTSIAMGMVSEQTKLWGKAAIFYLYEHIYEAHGLVVFDNATSWSAFFFAMFMVDFFYYWFHRFCHEFHFAFTQHSVHHSGEDYNLATALRQGAFQWIIGFSFTLPLALIIPPTALFGHFFANTLAQFWFHTSQVGDLGLLEYILNTPSAHRMHHRPPGNCNVSNLFLQMAFELT